MRLQYVYFDTQGGSSGVLLLPASAQQQKVITNGGGSSIGLTFNNGSDAGEFI